MQRFDRTPQRSWLWLLTLTAAFWSLPATAQVVPDTTLGRGNNTITVTNGDRTDILGGLRRNSSLFQSFERFSIDTNQQVYFANPSGIRNIFSRVTGGSLSNINGLLGVAGSANLFFMNPNGIIFGPNARLDVSGSFLATTANAIEFADNQKFAATGDRAVPLVEVNIPIGLQYGSNPPAMLTNRGNLTAGKDLTLAAGNLDLQGQVQAGGNLTLNATDTVKIRDTVNDPFVARSGGDMVIQGDRGVDILALNHLTTTPFVSGGNLSLISDGNISGDAHYTSGGNFSILNSSGKVGNFLSIYDPTVTSNGNVSLGDYLGRSLQVVAAGSISANSITINGIDPALGPNQTLILRAGIPGTNDNQPFPQTLNPPENTTFNKTLPAAAPSAITLTGSILTTDGIVRLEATGPISIGAQPTLTPDGVVPGDSIFAQTITISTPSDVVITGGLNARQTTPGAAGDISIGSIAQPANSVTLGIISSRNSSTGDGGNITINTTGAFTTKGAFALDGSGYRDPNLRNPNPENIVSIASQAEAGRSGEIHINAGGAITLAAGISSASNFNGKGADVTLEGTSIDTTRGVITSRNDGVVLGSSPGFIANPGVGGDVTLTATTGDIHSGGINASSKISNASVNQLSTSFTTIKIHSEGSVFVENNRQIVATNSGFDSTGNTVALGGDVIINAGEKVRIANSSIQSQGDYRRILIGGALVGTGATQNIEIDNSNLKTDSFQQPNAGAIMLNAQKVISILGGSQITSKAAYQGTQKNKNSNPERIADITVTGGAVDITNSLIDASTSGTTQGGNVVIAARNGGIVTLLDDQNPAISTIKTTTTGRGDGGSIIVAGKTITSTGYSVNTSSSGGTGNAGSITFGELDNNITLPDKITVLAPIKVDTINLTDSNLTTSEIGIVNNQSNSGDIRINANQTITTMGGSIKTTAGNSQPGINSNGEAGSVSVVSGGLDVNAIKVTNTEIDAAAFGSMGRTGSVSISAFNRGDVSLTGQQTIFTDTFGNRPTGDLIIRGGNVLINGYTLNARVRSLGGNGGNILVDGNSVTVKNNSLITTETSGSGNSGKIQPFPRIVSTILLSIS